MPLRQAPNLRLQYLYMRTPTEILYEYPLIIVLFITVIIIIGLWLVLSRRRYPYYACETLLTPAELKFYRILQQAIPDNTAIMMKVRMADIINCDDRYWRAGWGQRISAKHIDFVIIDSKTTRVIVAIELDDSTHRTNQDRIDRDKFVNKAFDVAGVTLHRIPLQKWYDAGDLKKLTNGHNNI